jgi:ferritin-like metal-binding protein YciE
LREARADELALARTLRSHIAAAPRGLYRSGLQRYLRETRGHARRLDGRLHALGAGVGPLRSSARALRDAGGGMLAWGRAPLRAIPGSEPDEKILRGAQFGCATEGLVIATYMALETVAERCGDHETVSLATEILAEEQRMLTWLRHEILKLTDPFVRDQLEYVEAAGDGRWSRAGEVGVDDVQRALARAERGHAHRL